MRLINADKLIQRIVKGETSMNRNPSIYTSMITEDLYVDAEPVRHGRWITDSCPMDDGEYLMERCTACGTPIEYGMGTPYCPFCGAKMDSQEIEE